ncbi:FMN-dependent dehydrogenase-domain-containing protein [Cytidiella melzeri]|nr:FMN-dependent dehydrogenase-domain-containing protein [Cytidiella melzeri]
MPHSLEEVAKHNNATSCWVIIKDKVYDVTEFLPEHPGGTKVILKYAGKDATAAYEPIHPPDALDKNLPPHAHLGQLDTASAEQLQDVRENREKTQDELRMEQEQARKRPLNQILNIVEMEEVARKIVSSKAYAYFASAADDEITMRENARAFSRFYFIPRVMRRLSVMDTSTTILGYKSPIPMFVSAAALAKLGHPLGETNITIGAGRSGIIQMVSSNASLSFEEIANSRVNPDQVLFFQLYKHRDNAKALERVREAERLGYKAIFLTVDAPIIGNRERDVRASWELEDINAVAKNQSKPDVPLTQSRVDATEEEIDTNLDGTVGQSLANDDIDMTWDETIPWLRSVTKLPIVVKGIQCVEDAVLAAEAGVEGILISNHGGRQMEYALPSIEVLYRIRKQRPDLFDKMEIYVDGGVKRGTDILKAVCLGAKACGLGRPFLYAQSAYGAAGVIKIIRILEREILWGMRLLGARSVKELVPEMVERVDWETISPKL